MRQEGPRWWREPEHGDIVWMPTVTRYRGFTDENLRVCLHGSYTAAISTCQCATARVVCACVRHRTCQAVKMLSNAIHSLHAPHGATKRGTLREGRQQHFAPFTQWLPTFESESHGQACSALVVVRVRWSKPRSPCLLILVEPRAVSQAWGLLGLGLRTRKCALSSNNPIKIKGHSNNLKPKIRNYSSFK